MSLSVVVTHNNLSCDLGNICVGNLKLTYVKRGEPSVLEFSVARNLNENVFGFYEGDSVAFSVEGKNMFFGYIFSKVRDKEQIITVRAYDSLRYLKNRDTYIYSGQSASSLLRLILADYNLPAGEIEETGYILPDRIESNQSLFDIILSAEEINRKATGREFILYDDFGKICFKNKENMELPLLASSEMDGLIDFKYTTSIDNDTYNKVKLFVGRESDLCYQAQDSSSVDEWGVLQYTEVLTREELLSGAAFAELAGSILSQKNRKTRELVIEDMGDCSVRAGCFIWVYISGDVDIARKALVSRAVHTFENGLHKMKLSLELEG